MTHYIGLDAHSNTCTAVVMNSTGELKARATFDTSEKNLLELIRASSVFLRDDVAPQDSFHS